MAVNPLLLERTGTVVRCDANRVEIELDVVEACAGCAGPGGCGNGPQVHAPRRGAQGGVLTVPGARAFQPGERVRLCLPAPGLLRAAALAYGWPLAGMFGAASVAAAFSPSASDAWAAAAAIAGLAAGFLASRRHIGHIDGPRLLAADPPAISAP
ncbi:MAG: SoxR reducing system RseC family protein [Chromatiales bacterium]|nr:MAG: SoxR reducing system RseC family protein [Chromatiales bacterium]